jgi:hypothetical protein
MVVGGACLVKATLTACSLGRAAVGVLFAGDASPCSPTGWPRLAAALQIRRGPVAHAGIARHAHKLPVAVIDRIDAHPLSGAKDRAQQASALLHALGGSHHRDGAPVAHPAGLRRAATPASSRSNTIPQVGLVGTMKRDDSSGGGFQVQEPDAASVTSTKS